jgi:hypothetical protein
MRNTSFEARDRHIPRDDYRKFPMFSCFRKEEPMTRMEPIKCAEDEDAHEGNRNVHIPVYQDIILTPDF